MINELKINQIIRAGAIHSLLQPIVSIKEKRVIGFEVLSRGIDPDSGDLLPPLELFEAAHKADTCLELDRLCRKKAVEKISAAGNCLDTLLFFNFDASILDKVTVGCRWMEKLIVSGGFNPKSVAIEIVESRVNSEKKLIEFVELYKELGFLIVMDDFGAQHSNLDRICLVKPDIIKIDRKLIENLSNDFYKISIVSSIVDLANRIGILTLAEGVENIDDIIKCYELGINLFQGYFFSRPVSADADLSNLCKKPIYEVRDSLMQYLDSRINQQMHIKKGFDDIVTIMCYDLSQLEPHEYNTYLNDCITSHCDIDCAYVISESGQQISETICKQNGGVRTNHPLFSPAAKGTDHSLKPYYYYMKILNTRRFFSESYLSLATGAVCRTMSAQFSTKKYGNCILCIDFVL